MDSKLYFIKRFSFNLLIFTLGISAVMLIITAIDNLTGIAGLGILLCLSSLVLWMLWGTTQSQLKEQLEKTEKKD